MDPLACDVGLNGENCSQAMRYATQNFNFTEAVDMIRVRNIACGASRRWTPSERFFEVQNSQQAGLYSPYLSEETRARIRDILCLIYRHHLGMRGAMSIVAALLTASQERTWAQNMRDKWNGRRQKWNSYMSYRRMITPRCEEWTED